MPVDSKRMVRVIARNLDDLNRIIHNDLLDDLENICGAMAGIIAERVLEGGGMADVLMRDVATTLDCRHTAETFLERFSLYDPKTGKPLLFVLMHETGSR